MSREQWPAGANSGPTRPIYVCAVCGMHSSAPINHTHSRPRSAGGAR